VPATTERALRTCPHCGFEEPEDRERCSRCGRSVLRSGPARGRRRLLSWIAAGVVLVLCVVAVVALSRSKSDRQRRERAEVARAVAVTRARLVREQAPHRSSATDLRPGAGAGGAARRAARARFVTRVEAAITTDARARAARGELQGPIGFTECGPFLRSPDAVPDDRVLAKAVGRYDCVAVKRDVRARGRSVGRFGYPFVAALDFERFTYVWCRNNPPQSERGQALVYVRLQRVCLAARGRALGTGYVDVPGS
jgi:predicted nucleic acid-binding Zn ribbon protein